MLCDSNYVHDHSRHLKAVLSEIKENGLRVDGKENTSPKQIPIVNRQMLAILKQMDITTDNVVREDGEENDAL